MHWVNCIHHVESGKHISQLNTWRLTKYISTFSHHNRQNVRGRCLSASKRSARSVNSRWLLSEALWENYRFVWLTQIVSMRLIAPYPLAKRVLESCHCCMQPPTIHQFGIIAIFCVAYATSDRVMLVGIHPYASLPVLLWRKNFVQTTKTTTLYAQ